MKFGLREIVFVVLLLAIPLGAWYMVFRPANRRNTRMMSQIQNRQAKLQALNKATATIGDLKNEIEALDKGITFFHSRLPNEKEIDKVLQEVWRLAEENNLATKSIRTVKGREETLVADPSGPYAEQPISMQLEGPFAGLYGFLLAMEAQPRIMRLQEMSIEKLPKAGDGSVHAECTVSIFFERAKE
jgi:Tfp pilus assembly protein PilO